MNNHKIIDGVVVALTQQEEEELIRNDEDYIAEAPMRARSQREEILVNEVDPVVSNSLRWAELTDAKQAEWTQYRTDLLNLPDQAGFPNDITWPTKPT